MALLVGFHDPQNAEQLAACYHGEDWLLRDSGDGRLNVDCFDIQGGHWVDVPYHSELSALGWARRGGRLPICPEHKLATDEPY